MIAQQQAAAAGVGIVLLPLFVAARDPRLQPILTNTVSVKRDLWFSVHRDLQKVPRVKAVMEFVAGLVRGEQDFLTGKKP
jgi:DNA-binding transcriptional LysR family regulator